MKNFLIKLGLIDYLTISLEIDRMTFIDKLRKEVEIGSTGSFNPFEVFSSSKKIFKGHIGHDDFKIKKKRKFFDTNMNMAVAKGKITQDENSIKIDTEINGFSSEMIPLFVILPIAYLVMFTAILSSGGMEFEILFLVIHAIFMFGLPYLMMKNSTKSMKRDLEREFFYLTKKSSDL